MPVTYQIDAERSLVRSRAWGVLTGEEIHAHYRRLFADPGFTPAYRQLVDLREVTRVEVARDRIREIAADFAFSPDSRRAYVASADVAFGTARMLEAYVELAGGQIEVFREMRAAEEWLGV